MFRLSTFTVKHLDEWHTGELRTNEQSVLRIPKFIKSSFKAISCISCISHMLFE